jgi:putative glutamine amidotransferase
MLGKQSSAVPYSYIKALARVDATPFIVPIHNNRRMLGQIMKLVDGLMLIGGPDIDPAHYGQPHRKGLRLVTPERDIVELTLTRWALRDRIPVLAICRGIQMLNVAAGGSLIQDIANQLPGARKHDQYPDFEESYLAHDVQLTPESRLARICKKGRLTVNSLHHQAIDRLGAGLRVVARADDGVIEAVEGMNHTWTVGVQWHPEWLIDTQDEMTGLFRAFVDSCRSTTASMDRVTGR